MEGMKTVTDYPDVRLMIVGLLADLFLYCAAARRFAGWFIDSPAWKPLPSRKGDETEMRFSW